MTESAPRASVRYTAPESLQTDATPSAAPSPGPHEVLVASAYVGVCGTDLHIYQGHMAGRVGPGTVLGHESSGVVAAVGDQVSGWREGEPVVVFPVVSCGTCRTCVAGLSHICPKLKILGIDLDGAMQPICAVPAANLVKLPANVPLRTAALVEPLAVAVHDVRRGRVQYGEHVLVVGAGPVGVLIALVARERGADVTVVELNESRRRAVANLGFRAVAPDAASVVTAPDVAFEVTGVGPGLDLAFSSLTPGGRLVAVGIHPEPRPLDLQVVFQREIEILGARLYTRQDFADAVDLIATRRVDPTPLVSEVAALSDAHTVFKRLLGGEAMKILLAVDPTQDH